MGFWPISGAKGRIDWGYFTAGAIQGYSLKKQNDGTWALSANLVSFDAFKIRQKPLTFIAWHKEGEWRWPIRSLDVGDGSGPRPIRGVLGAQLPEMLMNRR